MPTEIVVVSILALQLAVITAIDMHRQMIPDLCNIALALTGLAVKWFTGTLDVVWVAVAVVVFAGTFGFVREVHRRARGQVGLGLGDVKMAAAAACWITIASFPLFLAVSSLGALLFVAVMLPVWKSEARTKRVPFGPFLAAGLLLTWTLEGNSIFPLLV